jgi:hypothetical protein
LASGGRKKGYRDEKAHARLSEELKVAKSEYEKVAAEWHEALKSGGGFDMRGRKAEAAGRVRRAEEALESIGTVPDAPFKTSWHELAMKRMIRYAVDNGYDAISWTKGETQFNRYGSDEIAWVKASPKFAKKFGKPGSTWKVKGTEQRGGEADGVNIEDAARAQGILKEGGKTITSKDGLKSLIEETVMYRQMSQFSPENYDSHVNKLTDRIWSRMQNEDAGTSLPRKEGMEGFYDKMLPRMKTWKKLGLKVEEDYVGQNYHIDTLKFKGKTYYRVRRPDYTTVENQPMIETRGEAESYIKGLEPLGATHIVNFTPDVKAKVLDGGLARFMPDAAAPNTLKNQLGWSLIKGQGNKWRVYKPDGTLAGIAATKASAERMFRTKYKRELRKADK